MRNLKLVFLSLVLLAVGAAAQSLPTATLTASDGVSNPGGLGDSVVISGSTIAAGAPGAANGLGGIGVVYVFTKTSTTPWIDATESARLIDPFGEGSGTRLGASVAMSGDGSVIVASTPGLINVFLRPAAGWTGTITPTTTLTVGPPPEPWFLEGTISGVAMNATGTTIVAGAPSTGHKAHFHNGLFVPAVPNLGAVYMWVEPASGWASAGAMNETAILTASDGVLGDQFGAGVAIGANTVAVSASTALHGFGKVYVFQKPLSGWLKLASKFVAELTITDGTSEDRMGSSIGVGASGALIAAGTLRGCQPSAPGATYVFARPAKGWPLAMTQTAELTPSDADMVCFGQNMAVVKDLVIVGAPRNPPQQVGTYASGADYTFAMPANGWTDMSLPASMLPASNFGEFGTSNSIGGKSLAVGAPSTTVSGSVGAGAVYVFSN